jgi:hypothetical protein
VKPPKPSIPFEQVAEPDADGLTAAEVRAFQQYAEERGLTEEQTARLKKVHRKMQQESRKLGAYSPSPGAVLTQDNDSNTLTKIGQE